MHNILVTMLWFGNLQIYYDKIPWTKEENWNPSVAESEVISDHALLQQDFVAPRGLSVPHTSLSTKNSYTDTVVLSIVDYTQFISSNQM